MDDHIINEPAIKYNYTSPEDYLSAERAVKEKHEYYDGRIIAMAGASFAHNEIVANVIRHTGNQLEGKKCRIYPSDLRIKILGKETYTYPDATIICGEPEFTDDHFDTIKNPIVIFEVASASTEEYDKGKKFFYYRQIGSLKEYIQISTKNSLITVARRQPDSSWKFEEYKSLEDQLLIEAVGISIPLKQIYENITFS